MAELSTIVSYFQGLQDKICKGLESLDGKSVFVEDAWERPGGGGGRSRILLEGDLIEKGGVNFSHVHGTLPEKISQRLKLGEGQQFDASGVSIVLHGRNPFVPIIHMNIRYFEMEDGTFWFGGGIDVTPIYFFEEDAVWFHTYLKELCDSFDKSYYAKFKPWCDDYFYLPHRKETRGIGGLFFDHLKAETEAKKEQLFRFVRSVGESFVSIYSELARRHRGRNFTEAHQEWQLLRRSRYVEFNLVYDKGTKFGLDTDGRTESILMSMPPLAKWVYNYKAETGSPEAMTMANLKPTDWV